MNTQKREPNIRFNQFKELWKVVKLDSISKKVKSKNLNNTLVTLPKVANGATSVWHQYVITCNERKRLIDYLNEKEIGTIIHYPIPPHLQECYVDLGYKEGDFPITERLAKTVLSIPMYNGMTSEEQEYVIKAINDFK